MREPIYLKIKQMLDEAKLAESTPEERKDMQRVRYEKLKAAGICWTCKEPLPESGKCETCLADKRKKAKQRREDRAQDGCSICGKKGRFDKYACKECRATKKAQAKNRRVKSQLMGICQVCHVRPALPNIKSCEACVERNDVRDAKRREDNPTWFTDRKAEAIKVGKCSQCFIRKAAKGGRMCDHCLQYDRIHKAEKKGYPKNKPMDEAKATPDEWELRVISILQKQTKQRAQNDYDSITMAFRVLGYNISLLENPSRLSPRSRLAAWSIQAPRSDDSIVERPIVVFRVPQGIYVELYPIIATRPNFDVSSSLRYLIRRTNEPNRHPGTPPIVESRAQPTPEEQKIIDLVQQHIKRKVQRRYDNLVAVDLALSTLFERHGYSVSYNMGQPVIGQPRTRIGALSEPDDESSDTLSAGYIGIHRSFVFFRTDQSIVIQLTVAFPESLRDLVPAYRHATWTIQLPKGNEEVTEARSTPTPAENKLIDIVRVELKRRAQNVDWRIITDAFFQNHIHAEYLDADTPRVTPRTRIAAFSVPVQLPSSPRIHMRNVVAFRVPAGLYLEIRWDRETPGSDHWAGRYLIPMASETND